jgi:hypothetical protein
LPAARGFDGEHVPGVLGDDVGDVGDDEINLVLGVGVDASPASVRTYLVETTVGGASGLYLHAPQAVVPAQDEVETFAVSIRLGDSKPRLAALLTNANSANSPRGLRVGRGVVCSWCTVRCLSSDELDIAFSRANKGRRQRLGCACLFSL